MMKNIKIDDRNMNSLLVRKLAQEYGVTPMYIRQCIRGERTSLTAEYVRRDYKKWVFELERVLDKINSDKKKAHIKDNKRK